MVKGETVELYIRDEFLVGKVYGCNIAVTNIGSSTQKLEVLVQIPEGSIPVANWSYTKGKYELIPQYSTRTFSYFFYFPRPGTFNHYPVHATKDKQVLAAANPVTLKVVEKPTQHDTSSWDYISQRGSPEQVLQFLSTQNISTIPLENIAWRMKDNKFFLEVTDLLRNLFLYDETLWSYGVHHNVPKVISEFLRHNEEFIKEVGPVFQSAYLTIDPVETNFYEHLEYSPLVNARAHQFGRKREILNDKFQDQYNKLLTMLIYKQSPTEADLLCITYYLLLHKRL
jgi:hypothetical protein